MLIVYHRMINTNGLQIITSYAIICVMAIQEAHVPVPSPEQPSSPEEVKTSALLNKKAWHESVDAAVTEARRTGEPLSVLFIDADYFKEINDTLGHDEGDVVIDELRGLIEKVVTTLRTSGDEGSQRPLDIVSVMEVHPRKTPTPLDDDYIVTKGGHIGGDEFGILAHTDAAGADIVKERVRSVFGEYINQPGKEKLREIGIDLSIGVGTLDAETGDGSAMLKQADEAMYQDKLAHLPELDPHQIKALKLTRFIYEQNGIKIRDVPKYFKIHFND